MARQRRHLQSRSATVDFADGRRPHACSGLKAAAAARPRRTRRGSGSAPAAHSWCAQIINLKARRAERQARETAKGQVDDIRPDTAFSGFFPRGIGRDRTRAKGHRGAGSSGGIITAPEPTNTRATEPEREPAPARDAPPRVIYLGPPADERAAERATGIVSGLADDAEKALGATLDYAADFIAPPPTKDGNKGINGWFVALPRKSNSVCILTAALVVRKCAHGKTARQRSIVVESSA